MIKRLPSQWQHTIKFQRNHVLKELKKQNTYFYKIVPKKKFRA